MTFRRHQPFADDALVVYYITLFNIEKTVTMISFSMKKLIKLNKNI